MKVLIDTNIILDVWLQREPFWKASAKVVGLVENKDVVGVLSPTSITTLHYLGRKGIGEVGVRKLLKILLQLFEIGSLQKNDFSNSLGSKLKDFEDAVLESIALADGLDYIVTRNIKDFKGGKVRVLDPQEFIGIMEDA
jgi:predicted nucleic acid-binding protein